MPFINLEFMSTETEELHFKLLEAVNDFNDKVCEISSDRKNYSKTMAVFLLYFIDTELKNNSLNLYDMTKEERSVYLKNIYNKLFETIEFIYENNISPAEILLLEAFH